MIKKAIFSFFLFSLISTCAIFAEEGSIGSLFNAKVPVKVYVKDMANESGQSEMVPQDVKKSLEESLANRQAMKFEIVGNPAESDIQIAGAVKKYQYMDRGPFKPNAGVGTTLLDAAATATSNYVEMAVEYTVIDTKTGIILWKNTVSDYIKKVMTPKESVPLIRDKISKRFIWKCFGKSHEKDTVRQPM